MWACWCLKAGTCGGLRNKELHSSCSSLERRKEVCGTEVWKQGMCTTMLWDDNKPFATCGEDGRLILTWLLEKHCFVMYKYTGLTCLRAGSKV
jgi:hypothetical protein